MKEKTFVIHDVIGTEVEVRLNVCCYEDSKGLGICLDYRDGEYGWAPFGNLTVNLSKTPAIRYGQNMAYLDVNNLPDAPRFVEENGLGQITCIKGQSEWCQYPLAAFDMDRLMELDEAGCLEYAAISQNQERSRKYA